MADLHISSAFDGGNIEVVEIAGRHARLTIASDRGSKHHQWFSFRVVGGRDEELSLRIENAGGASYPDGWKDYRACASYDGEHWFRVPTQYRDGELLIEHRPAREACHYAYFAPYSLERHRALIARASNSPRARAMVAGTTLDGRDLDLLRIGDPAAPRKLWVIARQHPGETMAEWFAEGLIERLVDPADPVSRELLRRGVFYVVPNMNPDGSFRGHLRTNAAGANLNREWKDPDPAHCPEIHCVRETMKNVGVNFCLDVHGDEALPYNFIAGADGVASLPEAVHAARHAYEAALVRASPDFQTEHGYPKASPGSADLRKASNYLSETFGALAMTLEQPFKDTKDTPDADHGWSPARCKLLGRANLDALWAVIDSLPWA